MSSSLGTALSTWAAEPIPAEKNSEFVRRYRAMADALDLVEATVASIPADLHEAGHELLALLRRQGRRQGGAAGPKPPSTTAGS